jgi:hypothetical protein
MVTKWNASQLSSSASECVSDGLPSDACAKIRAASERHRTDDIKAEAQGRAVTLNIAVEFQAAGAVLRLLTANPTAGDLTFADFAIPRGKDSLVSFPLSWLNDQFFAGEYPLRTTDGVNGNFKVTNSKLNPAPNGVRYVAQVTREGSHDRFELSLALSSESLTATEITVKPVLDRCPGGAVSSCALQNTARQLAAQLAETQLAPFVGRPFRPGFDHVPIKVMWTGRSYRFFGNTLDGRSAGDAVTLALAWS